MCTQHIQIVCRVGSSVRLVLLVADRQTLTIIVQGCQREIHFVRLQMDHNLCMFLPTPATLSTQIQHFHKGEYIQLYDSILLINVNNVTFIEY